MKEKTIKDITYLLNERNLTASVIRKKEYAGDIIIPKTVVDSNMSYRVTRIGDYAFEGCSSLTTISIPNSVTSIEHAAFKGCSSLTAISIPEGVKSIRENTFYGCSSLVTITIPNSVISIRKGAFCGCFSLPTITIPDSVTRIGDSAFEDCSSLMDITIPDGITSVGKNVFAHCSSLTAISIPKNVKEISTGYEVRVKEIFIGLEIDTYTDFHYYKYEYPIGAFHGCSSLTTIIVDHNNPTYDSRENCNAIIKRSTSTLILGCENTIIPNSVTSIGKDAFEHCSSLTAITFKGTIEQWKKIMLYSQNWEPTFVIHCTDGDIS